MTKDTAPGSSLSQARVRIPISESDLHVHLGVSKAGATEGQLHDIRSHEQAQHRQLSNLDSIVSEVVQTVSVAIVQLVDGTGSVVDSKTVSPDAVITQPDAVTSLDLTSNTASTLDIVSTISVPTLDSPIPTTTAPIAVPPLTTTSSTSLIGNSTASTRSAESRSTPDATTTTPVSLSSALEIVTSAPLTNSVSYPTFSGTFNSTSLPPLFSNSTTTRSSFANTTTLSSSSGDVSANAFTADSSTELTSVTESPSPTIGGGVSSSTGGHGGQGATITADPTASIISSSGTPAPAGLTTTQTYVVGGVVGGIAGVAIIALALMIFLKWKKHQGNSMRLLGDADGPVQMTQRSGPRFSVPTTFAGFAAGRHERQQKRLMDGSTSGDERPAPGEQGFHRISGRKLTSVLQSGGDGYSDPSPPTRPARSPLSQQQAPLPRESVNPFLDPHHSRHLQRDSSNPFADPEPRLSRVGSGTESFYSNRDSMAAFAGLGTPPLQLGSPMRPESGIMMMRSGPARTPVQEHRPFPSGRGYDDRPLTPPTIDPLGRSLARHGGSHASSASSLRFTEEL